MDENSYIFEVAAGALYALVGLSEIFTIGVIWLVFFPPHIYRNRFAVPEPTPEATGTT